MKNLATFGIGLVLLVASASAAQRPQFGTRTDAVYLDLTVSDQNGHIIAGLERDDFEVRDEGILQNVSVFSNAPAPVSIAVLVDVSRSMTGDRLTAAARAVMALGRSLRAGDQWSAYSFSDRLTRLFDWEPFSEGHITAFERLRPGGGTELFQSVIDVIPRIRGAAHRKRALWILTDGADNANYPDPAVNALRSGEMLVYALGLNWKPAGGVRSVLQVQPLRRLAEPTGGAVAVVGSMNDAELAARSLGDELRVQYTIGFYPTAKPDGRYHRVTVTAKHPGYQVRTRLGYLAPRP